MKERILLLLQGIGIGLFGGVCILYLGFEGIGVFFLVAGVGIALTAIFGGASKSVNK
jgi:hypothetical protein